jgi:pyrroloquinoline quinone biosynthesis protein B
VDRARPLDGIFLTHAHIGHYTGLMYLGREALNAAGVSVYATPRMARFLRDNAPWSQLVALGNIVLREIRPGRAVVLTPGLSVTPFLVPHRDELSDTVGFRVKGPSRSVLYVPDIDAWRKWDRAIADEVAAVSVALLDGTFLSAGDVPGRSQSEVPHPPIEETMSLLAAPRLRGRTLFTHLNHTNPLLWDRGARERVEAGGFGIARDGQELPL